MSLLKQKLPYISNKLKEICSVHLAEAWDNVGLLIDCGCKTMNIDKIMITNDLTEPVLDEAIEKGTNLIVSYHPPIFASLKKLTMDNWKERIVINCIRNNISVFAPHTGLDAKIDGINDWLISPFDVSRVCSMSPASSSAKESMKSFYLPYSGKASELCIQFGLVPKRVRLEFEKADFFLVECVSSRYDEIAKIAGKDIMENSITPKPEMINGCGRVAVLKKPATILEVVDAMKDLLAIPVLKIALGNGKNYQSPVECIAVCAGSGGTLFTKSSQAVLADFFITGEASHHEQLELVSRGASVITTGHSLTERNYLKTKLLPLIQKEIPHAEVYFSCEDKEPGSVL